jgi:hypothetical protein
MLKNGKVDFIRFVYTPVLNSFQRLACFLKNTGFVNQFQSHKNFIMEKTIFKNILPVIVIFFLIVTITFMACRKDKSSNSGSASTTIKVTDAPFDDASVTGAFVTITDIKLDGQSVQGFTKTTIDLNAYQNGATKTIGNFNLQGKTYSTITFILDYETDASGTVPGCYIVTTGAVKHKLQSASNSITLSKDITLQANTSNSIVADFDLRKMIIRQSGGGSDKYDFATAAELQSSIRVVAENNTGTISGTITDAVSGSGKLIAYAYKKGTYNRSMEMQGQGTSSIEFKNAVTSSLVTGSGSYQLHFLEGGDYEVHFASYKDTNADGVFELKGTLVVVGAASLDFLNLTVSANATLTANATVTAVFP